MNASQRIREVLTSQCPDSEAPGGGDVTRAKAGLVLSAVETKYAAYVAPGDHPVLVHGYEGAPWAVVWEGGPYEWAIRPLGEVTLDPELTAELSDFAPGHPVHNRAAEIPAGVTTEPIASYALGVYPA